MPIEPVDPSKKLAVMGERSTLPTKSVVLENLMKLLEKAEISKG
jgi:hypothetical protein